MIEHLFIDAVYFYRFHSKQKFVYHSLADLSWKKIHIAWYYYLQIVFPFFSDYVVDLVKFFLRTVFYYEREKESETKTNFHTILLLIWSSADWLPIKHFISKSVLSIEMLLLSQILSNSPIYRNISIKYLLDSHLHFLKILNPRCPIHYLTGISSCFR